MLKFDSYVFDSHMFDSNCGNGEMQLEAYIYTYNIR